MKTMKSTGICIEVRGDRAVVTGPKTVMGKVFNLPEMNYIEIDGKIQTVVHDPIAHSGESAMNSVMQLHRTEARADIMREILHEQLALNVGR